MGSMRTLALEVCTRFPCTRLAAKGRRGLCRGCYLRDYRGTAIPEGARCECGMSNPAALVKTGPAVRCYNCRALARAALVA